MYQGNKMVDMSVETKDYQPKVKEYAGMQEGKTTQYIERRDRIQSSEAGKVKGQSYKGRYD